MRLGFWNRLAIVAFVVGVPSTSLYAVIQKQDELEQTRQTILGVCERAVESGTRPANGWDGKSPCIEMAKPSDYTVTGGTWTMALKAHALLGLCIYALIAAVVWVAKWVWRGRAPG